MSAETATVSKNIAPDSTESDQIPLFDVDYRLVDMLPGVASDDVIDSSVLSIEMLSNFSNVHFSTVEDTPHLTDHVLINSFTRTEFLAELRHVDRHWNMSPSLTSKYCVECRSLDVEVSADLSDCRSVCVSLPHSEHESIVENCETLINSSCRILLIVLFDRRNVFPRLVGNDLVRYASRASENLCNLSECDTGICHFSYLDDLELFEKRHVVALSSNRSASSYHVSHVVEMSSESEIVGIDVKRNVQVVQNEHAIWNWFNKKRVRRNVSTPPLVVCHETTISTHLWSLPNPRNSTFWRIAWHIVSKSVLKIHAKILDTHNHILFISHVNVQSKCGA